MQIAMSNALSLTIERELRFLRNFSGRDLAWLVIGVLLAMGVMFVLSRQRRRWF
jgi:predicted negative regulator of RcsB-dependent stress response